MTAYHLFVLGTGVVAFIPALLLMRLLRLIRRSMRWVTPYNLATLLWAELAVILWEIYTIAWVVITIVFPSVPTWFWTPLALPIIAASGSLTWRAYRHNPDALRNWPPTTPTEHPDR